MKLNQRHILKNEIKPKNVDDSYKFSLAKFYSGITDKHIARSRRDLISNLKGRSYDEKINLILGSHYKNLQESELDNDFMKEQIKLIDKVKRKYSKMFKKKMYYY